MLPNKGAAKGRNRGRGGLRGATSSSNGSRPRNETRKVHFEAQDGSNTSTSTPRSRENSAPRTSRTLPRDAGRIHAALSKSFDNKSRSPSPSVQGGQQGSFQQRYQLLRKNRETERAQAIANGFLADPDKPRTLAEAITPVGTCQDMCAEYERLERIVQNDVWVAEMDPHSVADQSSKATPAESRMVKKFRRAAAGIDEQLPSDLRPPHILQKTLNYLFDNVIGQAPNLAIVHHFVWDRTRAIRNDFSIQQVSKVVDLRTTIDSYERIARFHILSLHQLALPQKPYDKYDAQQEREQLDKTLLSLIQLYDDSRGRLESPNEAEFRAYCVIFQIQDPVPDLEDRVQAWPRHIFQDTRVQRALRLYAAASNTLDDQGPLKPRTTHPIAQENWRKFWRIVASNEVSYLMACVAEIYFGLIRRITINSIWKSYRLGQNKRTEDWTLSELGRALCLEDEEEVRDFCGNYGFGVVERADGMTFLDLNSVTGKTLPYVASGSQMQSRTELVERKRHHRTLPAIINGLSVQAAKDAGLVEAPSGPDEEQSDKDSLFVKDFDDDRIATALHQRTERRLSKSAQPKLNPIASSFQPTSSPFSPSNGPSFASGTSTNPFSATPPQASRLSFEDVKTPTEISRSSIDSTVTTPSLPKTDSLSSTTAKPSPAPSLNFLKPLARSSPLPSAAQGSSTPHAGFGISNAASSQATPSFGLQSPQPASDAKANAPIPQQGLPVFPTPFSAQPIPPAGESKLASLPITNAENSTFGKTPFAWSPAVTTSSTQTPSVPTTSIPAFNFSAPATGQMSNVSSQTGFHFNVPPSSPSNFQFNSSQPTTSTAPATPNPLSTPPNLTGNSQIKLPTFNFGTSINNTAAPSFPTSNLPNHPLPTQPSATSLTASQSLLPLPSQLFAPPSESSSHKTSNLFNYAPIPSIEPNKKPQRSAESIAASKAKASVTMTRYARTLVEEPNGLLEQFIESIALPMIRATKEEVEAEEMREEADAFRYDTLANRYGKRWREICWNRRLSRQRRERRSRLAKAIEDQVRQSRESSIQAQLDTFREMRSNSHTSSANSPTPTQQKRPSGIQSKRSKEHQRSLSRSPPKERVFYSRQNLLSSAASATSLGESTLRQRTSSALNSAPVRFASSGLPFGNNRESRGSMVRRHDTTRSAYFKLKAMGLDPTSDTLFSSTATPNDRKRPQGAEFDTTSRAAKKPVLQIEQKQVVVQEEAQLIDVPAKKSALTEEDEKLFAAVRAAREAMSDSVSFYKEEAAREEARKAPGVAQPSGLQSTINSLRQEDWFRASVSSTSSSTSKKPPPKYRDRVSKFLPRERYADVFKHQNRAVMGRSWPRPSPAAASSQVPAPVDRLVNDHNNISTAKNLRGGESAPIAHEKRSLSQTMCLSSDEPEASEYNPKVRIQPPAPQSYMNGFGSELDAESERGDVDGDGEEEENYNNHDETEEVGLGADENANQYFEHDDDGDDIHYHAPAPIHNNRYGILEQDDEEDDDDGDEDIDREEDAAAEAQDDGEDDEDEMDEVDEVEDEEEEKDGTSNYASTALAPQKAAPRYASDDDESDVASDMESPSSSARSSAEDEDEEDEEEEEEEEAEQQPRRRRPVHAAQPSQTSWGGKGGTSVEDAIEL